MFWPNRVTPARPRPSASSIQPGADRAGEGRDEDRVGQPAQHRVRRPDVGVLAHPFTAPAIRPLVMRRWTMRKKTSTGIVNRVEAAMIDPQSTVPRP